MAWTAILAAVCAVVIRERVGRVGVWQSPGAMPTACSLVHVHGSGDDIKCTAEPGAVSGERVACDDEWETKADGRHYGSSSSRQSAVGVGERHGVGDMDTRTIYTTYTYTLLLLLCVLYLRVQCRAPSSHCAHAQCACGWERERGERALRPAPCPHPHPPSPFVFFVLFLFPFS